MRTLVLALALATSVALGCESKAPAPPPTPAPAPAPAPAVATRAPLVDVTAASGLAEVRAAFNAHRGEIRFLTLLSPT